MVGDRMPVPVEAHRSAEQRAGIVGRASDLAGEATTGGASRTRAAAGKEGHHHSVAGHEVGDTAAEVLDDSGGLMAEKHRSRPHPIAVDDRQVGMADARHLDAHQELSWARSIQFQPANRQGSGCGEGWFRPAALEYRADDLH